MPDLSKPRALSGMIDFECDLLIGELAFLQKVSHRIQVYGRNTRLSERQTAKLRYLLDRRARAPKGLVESITTKTTEGLSADIMSRETPPHPTVKTGITLDSVADSELHIGNHDTASIVIPD